MFTTLIYIFFFGEASSPPPTVTYLQHLDHNQRIGYPAGFVSLLFFLFLSLPAFAAPCTEATFYDGFAGQFFGTSIVTGFMYGLDETYLYVTQTNGKISGYINVPQSTAQNFNSSLTPDTFYTQQIEYTYRRPLMTEDCQNLLTEDGHYLLAF